MEEEGIHLDAKAMGAALNACSHSGLVDEARNLYVNMRSRYGVEPGTIHLNSFVDCLSRAKCLDEAEQFIRKTTIPKPDIITWMALLGPCRWHGDEERVKRLLPEIFNSKDIQKTHDDIIGLKLIEANVYAGLGDWDRHQAIHQQLTRDSHGPGRQKVPGRAWIEVDGTVNSFIAHDVLHPRSKEIYAELDRLEEEMQRAGFQPDTRFVAHNVSDTEKKRLLCHHSEKLAIAFGLISTPDGTPLLLTKNLRVCPNCHAATALISKLRNREIIVRDANRFHHFKNGICSCGGYW